VRRTSRRSNAKLAESAEVSSTVFGRFLGDLSALGVLTWVSSGSVIIAVECG
jgi:hypothetical protein